MTCSYFRNSVWRKQNREWLSQGAILQIVCLRHSRETTVTIRGTCVSNRVEWRNHEYRLIIQVLHGSRKTFRSRSRRIISLIHVSRKIKWANHASREYPCTTLLNGVTAISVIFNECLTKIISSRNEYWKPTLISILDIQTRTESVGEIN